MFEANLKKINICSKLQLSMCFFLKLPKSSNIRRSLLNITGKIIFSYLVRKKYENCRTQSEQIKNDPFEREM